MGRLGCHCGLLGWRTRWTTVLNYVFWWSMQQRFPMLWDGGDNLLCLVLIYAMFADVGAYFSLDASRRRRHGPGNPALARAGTMVHNAAILAFAIQISLVYGVAGLYKVQSDSEMVYRNVYLSTGLTYATVLFQVSFPFLLFMNRYTRVLAVCTGLMFHVGIGLFLGLITLSLFMTAADLSLIDDDEYRALGRLTCWLAALPPVLEGQETYWRNMQDYWRART
jgi:hypothetical protein